MDTRWLQDFITLSELRNFTRAAEARNLSQAAFSRRIQSLENWAGARLIDRSAFPTQLTEAGERFRVAAIELVNQLVEARAGIAAVPARNQLRLATSYALATTHLPGWWRDWSAGQQLSCSLQTGNVHDTVSAFTSGAADLLICFHQVAQPLPLDLSRYDCLTLGRELIRPYAARGLVERDGLDLPGAMDRPVPLLMYSPSVYFARLIDAAIESGPRPCTGCACSKPRCRTCWAIWPRRAWAWPGWRTARCGAWGPPTSRRWPTAPGTSRYRSWRSRTAATRAPRSRPWRRMAAGAQPA
ncbi:LysR family transcriptional regulator [Achromobacter xylosoxidans]